MKYNYYMIFGGIWGGQLQRWKTGTYDEKDYFIKKEGRRKSVLEPLDHEDALCPKIAVMSKDMLGFEKDQKNYFHLSYHQAT